MSTKPIRLFVDAHSLDHEYQGTRSFIAGLYTALLNNFPDVEVYFGTSKPDKVKEMFPQVESERILSYRKDRPALLRFFSDIPDHLRKYHFDYAHFQYLSPRQVNGCKHIVTLHDVVFNDFPQDFPLLYRKSRRYLFGESIRKATLKTTVSEYSKQRIAHYYNLNERDIHLLPNGIADGFSQLIDKEYARQQIYAQYGIANFILYVSRIEPRKNHELLLRTYLRLRLYEQQVALVFIGVESIASPALKHLLDLLTPEQKQYFFWLKEVPQDDLTLFYSACRLFVYPSRAEGFGIPPLEAAACRAPVLCSSATAMQSYDFFDPWRFDPDNQAEFESKLRKAFNEPPTEDFLDRVALKARERYNWNNSSKLFYNLLQ